MAAMPRVRWVDGWVDAGGGRGVEGAARVTDFLLTIRVTLLRGRRDLTACQDSWTDREADDTDEEDGETQLSSDFVQVRGVTGLCLVAAPGCTRVMCAISSPSLPSPRVVSVHVRCGNDQRLYSRRVILSPSPGPHLRILPPR